VLAPLKDWDGRSRDRTCGCLAFLRISLPLLHTLRHLALHELEEIGKLEVLTTLCTAAGALPQIISLHLVRLQQLRSLGVKDLCMSNSASQENAGSAALVMGDARHGLTHHANGACAHCMCCRSTATYVPCQGSYASCPSCSCSACLIMRSYSQMAARALRRHLCRRCFALGFSNAADCIPRSMLMVLSCVTPMNKTS
jgi:hypothetical protein